MSVANRVFQQQKMWRLSLTGLQAGGLAPDAKGNVQFDLGDINWNRIVVEGNVTALTGTNVNIVVRTTNEAGSNSTSDVAALIQDASTAFASGAKTGTGKFIFATAKTAGTTTSNIAKFLEFHVTPSALSVLDGYLIVTVFGS